MPLQIATTSGSTQSSTRAAMGPDGALKHAQRADPRYVATPASGETQRGGDASEPPAKQGASELARARLVKSRSPNPATDGVKHRHDPHVHRPVGNAPIFKGLPPHPATDGVKHRHVPHAHKPIPNAPILKGFPSLDEFWAQMDAINERMEAAQRKVPGFHRNH
ncbi:MAG: hypothetical protein H7287_00870 [Thermoleophilia bacterium]|nr:hypothetical protein [Thermoleophilia bacterium]